MGEPGGGTGFLGRIRSLGWGIRYEVSNGRWVKQAGGYLSLEIRRQVWAGVMNIEYVCKALKLVEIDSCGYIYRKARSDSDGALSHPKLREMRNHPRC